MGRKMTKEEALEIFISWLKKSMMMIMFSPELKDEMIKFKAALDTLGELPNHHIMLGYDILDRSPTGFLIIKGETCKNSIIKDKA